MFHSMLSLVICFTLVNLIGAGQAVDTVAQESQPNASAQGSAEIVTFTTQDDHRDMQRQLGITKLRPGPSGDPNNPNAANTDETKATPYPVLPELMRLKDGSPVTTREQWWKQRRPEIVEEFEREVLGRIPATVPQVTWRVVKTIDRTLGEIPVTEKRIVGRVDNSNCPEIDVNILMSIVAPREVSSPIPALMQFGFTSWSLSGEDVNVGGRRFGEPRAGDPPSKEQQLIEAGWAAVTVNANSIQEDAGGEQPRRFGPPRPEGQTGGGLTRGIIGLTNRGQPRKPDQWGSLRAWGWGASRALDFLEKEPSINATRVGIDGVSRYGKAALVTMAFDERFAMVLVGSSGEGGASLYRRNFGEAVENLTGSGEYHWMAGNFLKYGTAESSFGAKNANDLPIDAHMLIALCAPRMTFISYGVPEKGDALWLDQQGSFMATIAAQPAFRLLGARGLGRSDDYNSEKMPAVNTDMLDGELAWRQHDGGHTDLPNIPHFIKWANRLFNEPKSDQTISANVPTAEVANPNHGPIQRRDSNSALAHEQLKEKAKQGKIDVYFIGDSITRRWGATDYPKFLANWKNNFYGWNAANFGWGGDTTNNMLWRLQNGELDGVAPKIFVLQGGTNNLPQTGPADPSKVDEIVTTLRTIVAVLQEKSPNAKIVITGLFPRSQNPALATTILAVNEQLEKVADGKSIQFLNINSQLADARGILLPGMSEDGLHFTEKSYQIWADGLKPMFREILGEPSKEDHAPPPTGDPKAQTTDAASKSSVTVSRLTTPGAAEIPEAVRIPRPTTEEIELAEKAVAAMIAAADQGTTAVLKQYPTLVEVRPPRPNTAVVPNLAPFFRQKHESNVAVAKKGEANVLFLGDSITDFWRNENGPFAGKKVFDEYFGKWNVANFGIAGDTTQGVLYRLQHGEGEGFSPTAVMLMIGTNNSNSNTGPEIAEGIGAVVLELQKRFTNAKILLLGIFPRGAANDKVRTQIKEINQIISKLHDGKQIHFMDIGNEFLDGEGNIPKDLMSDALHPSAKGYEVWAKAVEQKLQQLIAQ